MDAARMLNLLLLIACSAQIVSSNSDDIIRHIQDVRIINYVYGVKYTISLNSSVEFIYEYAGGPNFKFDDSDFPARVSVYSANANRTFPVFITARQQRGVSSWQLPLIIDNRELRSLSRTLCPNGHHNMNNDTSGQIYSASHPLIHLYTSSASNVTVILKVDLVLDFYMRLNEKKTLTIGPSEPTVFYFSFDNDNSSISEYNDRSERITFSEENRPLNESTRTIILRLDSDDDLCMLISIQSATCPIFDTENDIMFEGYYETVSKRGGITIQERRFPTGFYVVLLVKTTDEDCTGYSNNETISKFSNFFSWDIQAFDSPDDPISALGNQNMNLRQKTIDIELYPSITYSNYWIATFSAILVVFLIYFCFLFGILCHKLKPKVIDEVDNPDKVSWLQRREIIKNKHNEVVRYPFVINECLESLRNNENSNRDNGSGSVLSLNSPDAPTHVYLDQLCANGVESVSKQSALYVWHLITIAVFYGLPVIQLVITYQRILNRTGNQDLCYYNFLCAHPLGYLSDFNHVYSNLGYALLGLLFLIIVWRRSTLHQDPEFDEYFGIPRHYGLYYAMGIALIMEGVLSASYHVCPNNSNFQFDTSFMYIMAVLCMVKIYQTRHPDINAQAHSTYSVLAAAVFICLIGVLYPNFYFWLFFTILHIGTCLFLTFQIYYFGQWKISIGFRRYKCDNMCKPMRMSRFILVIIANLCNWGLAGYGLYMHSKDFATHLLYVFLMNLALHLTFYITMKVAKGERPPIYTWLLLVVAIATWGGALFFFFSPSTSWALTPAQSRTYNTPCKLFDFYDNHDIWHMLSAAAMFFSFMLLLTLDDDLTHKLRSDIRVF